MTTKYEKVQQKLKVFRDFDQKSQHNVKKMVKSLVKDRKTLKENVKMNRQIIHNFEKQKIHYEGEISKSTSIIELMKQTIANEHSRSIATEKFASDAMDMAQRLYKPDNASNDHINEMAGANTEQSQQNEQQVAGAKNGDKGDSDSIQID